METKICSGCGKEKLPNEFYRKERGKHGRRARCIACQKIRRARYHAENREGENAKNQEYRLKNIALDRARKRAYNRSPAGIYHRLVYRCKKRSRHKVYIGKGEFVEWYNQTPKICTYCGLPQEKLPQLNDRWNKNTARLTIDRIDSKCEYELGNICLSCMRCNSIKNDFFTHAEMLVIGDIIKRREAIT